MSIPYTYNFINIIPITPCDHSWQIQLHQYHFNHPDDLQLWLRSARKKNYLGRFEANGDYVDPKVRAREGMEGKRDTDRQTHIDRGGGALSYRLNMYCIDMISWGLPAPWSVNPGPELNQWRVALSQCLKSKILDHRFDLLVYSIVFSERFAMTEDTNHTNDNFLTGHQPC